MLFIILLFSSCVERIDYPKEPVIKYKDFYIYSQNNFETGVFVISFTDGDGDIGLAHKDTLPPFNPGSKYFFNFFMTFYQQIDGNFEVIVDYDGNVVEYNSRIPPVNPDDEPQNLRGDIYIDIDISILKAVLGNNNVIKIEAYIVDRNLNYSNTIITPPLILP